MADEVSPGDEKKRLAEADIRTKFDLSKISIMKINFPALLISAWLSIVFTGLGDAAPGVSQSPAVPESLKPAPTESLFVSVHAKGVQIYECHPKKEDATQYEWVLKGPEADLFDAQGNKIGRHYAGPTWEAIDGSKVVGEVKGKEPSPDPDAIPWLLLMVKTHEGNGVFSHISSVQRVETTGGKAPAGNCDASTASKELRVPYTATYYFYAPRP